MPSAVTDTHALIWYLRDMPDRIIAATALAANLPLISRDGKIRLSGIATVW